MSRIFEPDPLKRMAKRLRRIRMDILNNNLSDDEVMKKYPFEMAFVVGCEEVNERLAAEEKTKLKLV